ncbi:uncharacterized protein [Elaeis guineensis]|uniref:Uncharacterized protein LOC105034670 isoform X1 n=1 Tax=Elaeis guineensis var. tenera TaxID=51953 RepID=A0A6I9QFB5_ELAGV|nr:uncharacterized protein LOC105034670 isoform X1 [Elaeis guineensis]
MASSSYSKMMAFSLLLSLFLHLPSTSAGVVCEDLPQDLCAFAISSSSKRCVLESTQHSGRPTEYQCRTSEVVVERMSDWIETDECVRACGADRNSVGISSDSLLEPQFTEKLCSPACHENCPNIIDLYFNLAAGEGVFLPDLCEARRVNPHRSMMVILSSGAAAGPAVGGAVSKLDVAAAPASIASPPASV